MLTPLPPAASKSKVSVSAGLIVVFTVFALVCFMPLLIIAKRRGILGCGQRRRPPPHQLQFGFSGTGEPVYLVELVPAMQHMQQQHAQFAPVTAAGPAPPLDHSQLPVATILSMPPPGGIVVPGILVRAPGMDTASGSGSSNPHVAIAVDGARARSLQQLRQTRRYEYDDDAHVVSPAEGASRLPHAMASPGLSGVAPPAAPSQSRRQRQTQNTDMSHHVVV